jgi:tRNA (cytidine(34)-2'-O)-methyltransferase
VALVEPEIPPNTGNIARLCAATRVPLHIVGVAGFRLDDRAVRRAGLDYWPEVELHRHRDLTALAEALPGARFIFLTTKAERRYTDWSFAPDDCLVFGRETRGAARGCAARELGAVSDYPNAQPARPQSQPGDIGRHRALRGIEADGRVRFIEAKRFHAKAQSERRKAQREACTFFAPYVVASLRLCVKSPLVCVCSIAPRVL